MQITFPFGFDEASMRMALTWDRGRTRPALLLARRLLVALASLDVFGAHALASDKGWCHGGE